MNSKLYPLPHRGEDRKDRPLDRDDTPRAGGGFYRCMAACHGHWVHVSEGIFPELDVMGLSIPIPKSAPKKRGRPRKNPLPDSVAPKKKRGRPPN